MFCLWLPFKSSVWPWDSFLRESQELIANEVGPPKDCGISLLPQAAVRESLSSLRETNSMCPNRSSHLFICIMPLALQMKAFEAQQTRRGTCFDVLVKDWLSEDKFPEAAEIRRLSSDNRLKERLHLQRPSRSTPRAYSLATNGLLQACPLAHFLSTCLTVYLLSCTKKEYKLQDISDQGIRFSFM